MSFPEFPEPIPLDGDPDKTWTACFDSFDQRHQVLYYQITLFSNSKLSTTFTTRCEEYKGHFDSELKTPTYAYDKDQDSHYYKQLALAAKLGRSNYDEKNPYNNNT